MQSIVINAADAIVQYLNGKTYNDRQIPFIRKLIPEKTLAQGKKLTGYVVPHSLQQTMGTRSAKDNTITIDIGIMGRASEHQLEEMLALTQQIGESLYDLSFEQDFRIVEVNYDPLYDVNSWLELHAFVAVISITIVKRKD